MADKITTKKYYDLRVYDRGPRQIYNDALLDLQTKLPEWTPREGSTEVLLLESLALEVAELAFTINRLPPGMIEILLKMVGLYRDPGTPPIANATFNFVNNVGYTVPAGTLLRLPLGSGLQPILFTTNVDLVIPPGSSAGQVAITALSNTDLANGVDAGTELQLMDQLIYVSDVVVTDEVVDGRSPENGPKFLERGVNRLSRLSDTLVLPTHFSAFAEEQVYVSKAVALDNYDADADTGGDGPVGSDLGHVTVAAYGQGQLLSTDKLTELKNEMLPISLGNLAVHVISPTMNSQDVEVEIKKVSSYETADVSANVINAIETYLSPDTWNWNTTLLRNDLIVAIGKAEGVESVLDLVEPAADVVLDGVAPLISPGEITLSIE